MKKICFKNLDITINSGELISVIGPNGSGKTIFLKKVCGRLNNDDIFIDDKNINKYDIEYKKNKIACVFDDNIYNSQTPKEELKYYLEKLNIDNDVIINRLNDFIEFFDLEEIIDKNFLELCTEERIFIKILSLLIIVPALFCIDDLLTYLNKDKKMKILNYIKDKSITLLCVTSNMDDVLLFDKILVINKGRRELFDKASIVLQKDDVFKELGLSLPFIYDINNMLKSYDLINEDHIVYRELVDLLWK